MAKVIILSADRWNMVDKDTGEALSGVTVFGVTKYRQDSRDSKGLKPVKYSLSNDMWKNLSEMQLPALCDAEYDAVPMAGGKAGLTIVDLEYLQPVELF